MEKQKKSKLFWVLVGTTILVVVFLGWLGLIGFHLAQAAGQVGSGVETIQENLQDRDLPALKEDILSFERALDSLDKALGAARVLTLFPVIDRQLLAAQDLSDLGKEILRAADLTVAVLDSLSTAVALGDSSLSWDRIVVPYNQLSIDQKTAVISALAKEHETLEKIRVQLGIATLKLDELESGDRPVWVLELAREIRPLLKGATQTADLVAPFSQIAPTFLGLTRDRQTLILFLNSDELRPTGGFLGVYGEVVMRDGDIKSLAFDDSYNLDQSVTPPPPGLVVSPPKQISQYLGVNQWYFRDSMWSPDFAEASKVAVQLLRQESAAGGRGVPEIHNVVGVTTHFAEALLSFLGPITVDGQTYDSANVIDLLQKKVEIDFANEGIALSERKRLVGKLAEATVDKIFSLPPAQWPKLMEVLDNNLIRKNLVLSSLEEESQLALIDAGWDGGLGKISAGQDWLLVADANLGALKTNAVVDRSVKYSIRETAAAAEPSEAMTKSTMSLANNVVGEVTIDYEHHGGFDWKTTRYLTYTRIFLPKGARLISSEGITAGGAVVEEGDDYTAFGGFIAIEPGKNGRLKFTFQLSDEVAKTISGGSYHWRGIKQVGAGDNQLTLDLDFVSKLAAAEPSESRENFGDSNYSQDFDWDRDVLVKIGF